MDLTLLSRQGFQVLTEIQISDLVTCLQDRFNESYSITETSLVPNKQRNTFTITLSSNFGLAEFPYHTDGAHFIIPPRWIILEYLGSNPSDTATLITDIYPLLEMPQYEDLFYNRIYSVVGGPNKFLTSLVNNIIYKYPIFRWNPLIMKPVNKKSCIKFEDLNIESTQRLEWYPNQISILDNWRVLHGREAVDLKEKDKRILKRYNLTPITNYASL